MKSTPDLLGDFRAKTGGQNLRDYFMKQKPKEQLNLEDVIKESVIEASNTEDQHQNIQDIDDAAEALLHQSLTNFDDDDREADQIRLRRIGQERGYSRQMNALVNGEEAKGDFERIFHDSGVEFAHFDGKNTTMGNSDQDVAAVGGPNGGGQRRLLRNQNIREKIPSRILRLESKEPTSPSANLDPSTINQNEIQARLVLGSAVTSSCNI